MYRVQDCRILGSGVQEAFIDVKASMGGLTPKPYPIAGTPLVWTQLESVCSEAGCNLMSLSAP